MYNFRLPLARAILACGHSVTLLSPPGRYGERLLAAGIDWRPLPLARRTINVPRELLALYRLVRMYRALRPDLVHHFTLECILLGSVAARIAAVPAVVNAATGLGTIFAGHSVWARWLRIPISALLKLAFSRSEAIVQNPEDLERLVRARVLDRKHAHLIRGSGVDMVRFAATPRTHISGEGTVLFASRLLRSKGIEEFVEAARLLKSRLPRTRLLVAGDTDPGSADSTTQHDVARWRQDGSVELLGHREDMPELLAATNLVVLPTYYGEGVPRILIEAAASGLPLVATDVPGCREVVRHEYNGLLVPARNPYALAAAIERLMLDAEERSRMGKRSQTIATRMFAEERVIRETTRVYAIALYQSADLWRRA